MYIVQQNNVYDTTKLCVCNKKTVYSIQQNGVNSATKRCINDTTK